MSDQASITISLREDAAKDEPTQYVLLLDENELTVLMDALSCVHLIDIDELSLNCGQHKARRIYASSTRRRAMRCQLLMGYRSMDRD